MATLTPQDGGLEGVEISYSAADAAGDEFENNGRTVLLIKNEDTVSHTATVVSQRACSQGFTHDVDVAVAAGTEQIVGLLKRGRFNDTDGNVQVTYDDVTSVTVAVVNV